MSSKRERRKGVIRSNQIQSTTEESVEEKDLFYAHNDYQQFLQTYVEGFMSNLFSQGIFEEVDVKQLQEYFANPEKYQKELENISTYFYISTAEVFQLFDLVRTLPDLNYKISAFVKNKNYEKHLQFLNRILFKVNHKQLTRDILSQEVSAGTIVGCWLGTKKKPYPYIFDNLDFVFPAYRRNGQWVVVMDLEWFSIMTEYEREIQLENFKEFIPVSKYNAYQSEKSTANRYIELPVERTFALRTHALKRNQRYGVGWATTGLFDILHKKKLKNMEKSVANKIINAIAVLTIGDASDIPENTNLKLPKAVKTKVHAGVKAAMEKNQKNGVTVVTIPDFAKLDFPNMNSDALDPDKFDSINTDIQSSYGISPALLNGTSTNFASAKLNLEVFYRRIGVLLEDVEREVYVKLFNWILPAADEDNYVMEYSKTLPISGEEKLKTLLTLHNEGFSVKHVVDQLEGVEFQEYIEQSIHESDELKLKEKILPYQTSHTNTGTGNKGGRPEIDDASLTNENTINTRTSNKNDN